MREGRLTLIGRVALLSLDEVRLAPEEEEVPAGAPLVGVASDAATVDKLPFVAAVNVIGAPNEAAPDPAAPGAAVTGAEVSVVAAASPQ